MPEYTLHLEDIMVKFTPLMGAKVPKGQNGTLDGTLSCTLDEMALLNFLKENPKAIQSDIAEHIGKSERTVKRMTPSLIERGLLERINGKGDKGSWVVKTKDKD